MKFLCPQCKAKYQIADDKIDGRTLRMKCRRCEHEIVVKGDVDAAGAEAAEPRAGGARTAETAAPAARTAGPRAAGSALGADFRRQMSAGAAEAPKPAAPAPVDAWHVAINEVPVGPMRREEIARKIAAGAIDAESLCWREGFDDWRPVRDVAELAPLLRRPAAPPAGARPLAPSAGRALPGPAKAGAQGAAARSVAPAAGARPGAAAVGRAAPAVAARSNVVPIGGRLGAAAAPAFDERPEEFDETEATMVARSPLEAARSSAPESAALAALVAAPAAPAEPPAAAAASPVFESPSLAPAASVGPSFAPPVREEAPRRRAPISPFVWVAAAGAMAFGVMLAVLVAKNMLQPPPAPAVAAVAPPAPIAAPVAPEQAIAIPEATPPPAALVAPLPEAPIPTPEAPVAQRGGTKRAASGSASGTHALSAAEQAEIDRMTGGGAAAPNLAAPTRPSGGSGGGPQGAELSADQLRAVVQRNRPGLQHCYEMAARQTGSSDTMRANVEVAVGGSGVVTRVSVTGPSAPAQLTTCLEGQVRRWHFPAGGEATFPVVFSPGG